MSEIPGEEISPDARLRARGKRADQEAKDALRSALRDTEETTARGAYVLDTLKVQTEQLGRVQGDLAEMNDSLDRSSKLLAGMKSIWGTVKNKFSKEAPETVSEAKASVKEMKLKRQKSAPEKLELGSEGLVVTDERKTAGAKTEKTEEDLLLESLRKMKGIAEDMGTELDIHKDLLEDIDGRMGSADAKMDKSMAEARRLRGKK